MSFYHRSPYRLLVAPPAIITSRKAKIIIPQNVAAHEAVKMRRQWKRPRGEHDFQLFGPSAGQGPVSGPGQNMPSGMTIIENTGAITTAPPTTNDGTVTITGPTGIATTFTNLSPNSISGTGEWAQNIQQPAGGVTGFQINFPETTEGANSPARLQHSSFTTTGTGNLFFGYNFLLSTSWSFSLASQVKMMDTHTVASGNNNIMVMQACNLTGAQSSTGFAFPAYLLQGNHTGYIPGGSSAPWVPPSFTGPGNAYNHPSTANWLATPGTFHTLEVLLSLESSVGAGNGAIKIWVDNVLQFSASGSSTGINYTAQGGYANFTHDPTYGGDSSSDHPPNTSCYIIFDRYFAAVS